MKNFLLSMCMSLVMFSAYTATGDSTIIATKATKTVTVAGYGSVDSLTCKVINYYWDENKNIVQAGVRFWQSYSLFLADTFQTSFMKSGDLPSSFEITGQTIDSVTVETFPNVVYDLLRRDLTKSGFLSGTLTISDLTNIYYIKP